MKKTIFLLLILILVIIIVGMFLIGSRNGSGLIGSDFNRVINKSTSIPSPTIAPPNAPKTYSFDSKTDLNTELEKVNPQVLDSDFEE